MTAVFRNRLIGSAILIIAAIVFLPDLLDGQKQVSKDDFKAIPERPEFASVAQQQVFAQDQHDASRAEAMALPQEQNSDPDPVPDSAVQQGATDVLPDQTYASVSTDSAAAKPTELTEPAAKTTETAPVQQPVAEPVKAEETIKPQPKADEKAKPATDTALTKAAWVVRVGSFSKEANANALISKLRAAGFATFSRKVVNAQGQTMVSVLVGPDLKKEKLENSLSQLQTLADVPKLKVVPFQPVENN
ncbi:SPOR domain-containing protein [Rheinheimera sp. 4Y26]|uniref:SPOR domain-containing protein n=1 Tax=Rheinheimera sp. 4Y26 TaxID=2977811 RepID=UPI0021B0DE61|nr:SPOR domain-containing protein [Rheinheimera sp. 4Y26]MCT6700072.1 SPOR domain-containing protein [Rheinheimera sp. 4Y26]